MVITVHCPSCSTAFPVDTAKVPEGGVYARCSECAGVFFVDHPDEARSVVREVSVAQTTLHVPTAEVHQAAADEDVGAGWEESTATESFESEAWSSGEEASVTSDPWSQTIPPATLEGDEGAYEWGPGEALETPEVPEDWARLETSEDTAAEKPSSFDTGFTVTHEVVEKLEVDRSTPPSGDAWTETVEERTAETFEITETFDESPLPTVAEPESAAPAEPETYHTPIAPAEPPSYEPPAPPPSPPVEERPRWEEPVRFQAPVAPPEPPRPVVEAPAPWRPAAEPPRPAAPPPPPPAPPPTFTFGRRDPHEKAKRLARVLVSDMIMYNPERHSRAIQSGSLREDFDDEIKKSWQEYVDQVGDEIAKSTSYFDDALNDILAKGQRVFP